MKSLIALLVVPFLFASPAVAGISVNERDTFNTQDNETSQENVGVVNQTAVYNLGQASTYRLGNITCPDANLMFSGNTTNFDDYAFSTAIVIPLGGRTKESCVKAAQVTADRMAFDAEASYKKECSALASIYGVTEFSENFPTLAKYCK